MTPREQLADLFRESPPWNTHDPSEWIEAAADWVANHGLTVLAILGIAERTIADSTALMEATNDTA